MMIQVYSCTHQNFTKWPFLRSLRLGREQGGATRRSKQSSFVFTPLVWTNVPSCAAAICCWALGRMTKMGQKLRTHSEVPWKITLSGKCYPWDGNSMDDFLSLTSLLTFFLYGHFQGGWNGYLLGICYAYPVPGPWRMEHGEKSFIIFGIHSPGLENGELDYLSDSQVLYIFNKAYSVFHLKKRRKISSETTENKASQTLLSQYGYKKHRIPIKGPSEST